MRRYSIFILFLISILLSGESIIVNIDSPDYKIKSIGKYDYIFMGDGDHLLEPGVPELPVCRENILLPSNAKNINLKIKSVKQETLSGPYYLPPVQKPAILSEIIFTVPKRVDENKNIYNLKTAFPKQIVNLSGKGTFRGMRTGDIIYHPFQWIPKEKKLVYNKSIELEINYSLEGYLPHRKRSRTDSKIEQSFFLNSPKNKYSVEKDTDDIDYLIITDSSFVDEFQDLLKWKREKGLCSKIATTDSIYNNCPGVDHQEMIRNCIKDYYNNYNLQWVLLGGDTYIIPSRIAFAMACEAGFQPSNEDSIPADLYYADLDGDWNENGNPPYGEVGDSIDLYPDVFVGRAPVDTEEEVSTFVSKVISYEKNPPVDYLNKALFLGEILWWDPYTDAGVGKNMIDSLYIPDWINITKLYQSLGNENSTTVRNAINNGQNLINHDGHAWYTVMGMGDDYFGYSDMDNLTNGDSLSILYSIGCWSNAFDYDAISEHFINNPNGGGVAFIGNSRYGWGSPGHPGFGYSDRFDADFYSNLFSLKHTNIGLTLAMTKADYIPRSRQENVYRIHQYQLNLLGDPEMPVWLDKPSNMLIVAPDTVKDNVPFNIRVTDTLNSSLYNVRLCITQINGDSIWERNYSDELGEACFTIDCHSPCSLLITATLDGYIPAQKTIMLAINGPYLSCIQKGIDEISGNNDGIINPGEEIEIETVMKNTGDENINQLNLLLKSNNPYIEITDSLFTYGSILEPDSTFQCTFSFKVDSTLKFQSPANFELIGTSGSHSWINILSEIIGIPDLLIEPIQITLPGGDSIPDGGDTLIYHYYLKNNGYGNGYGMQVIFSTIPSSDPYISFEDSVFYFDTLLADCEIEESLSIIISPYIDTYLALFGYNITTEDNFTFSDSFFIKIGETGFFDNLESGTSNWEHYGTNDLWHLSNYRSYSGNYSFYCGNEGTHQYINSMEAVLRSEAFTIFPPCTLSFYHWYEFPNYTCDGLIVAVEHSSIMDTLDYIGTGGALDSTLNTGNTWLPDKYDLSYLNPGSTIRLYFIFASDTGKQAEGIYIDDIRVTGSFVPSAGISLREKPLQLPSSLIHRSGLAYITLDRRTRISLDLYDRTGRLIRKLIDSKVYHSGIHPIKIPGNIPSGIYFLHLTGNDLREIRKLVILR